MAKSSGLILSLSGTGTTDYVRLGTGTWVIAMELGGSTIALEAKAYSERESSFRAIDFPLQSGARATTTSTDNIIAVTGGLDFRINVSTYSTAGTVTFSASSAN